ncbi:precorrin-4 C(11)-methyltransferase [Pyrobaculum neutrophilum]|uniref:uroporphyrinogen-III C-methyltransferase n=1 Tax=Pyrobaculum neutrophilum (strain DSM 2338 / JCM 9278 / NBRC 100436 / V24Sta) TaxID=444157 RepID=B1YBC1_PYRNV|nr:precorrin-4 C(11)-methyltransferase [Pyrobaculum neutrophilum]ACB39252.1 precorrin-4 C11-methyltransferase [Pyrobaculum neutrophilum V24Sta]
MAGKVVFVGAGPGDPELITVKGMKYLQQADVVVYAGSLVNPELLKYARRDAEVYNSASMTTEEIVDILVRKALEGKLVVRLKSGDSGIYGALWEEVLPLQAAGVPYEVVPGITAALAAAAVMGIELTIPKNVQTVVLTRASARVEMRGSLEQVARFMREQGAVAVIYTGVHVIDKVVRELAAGGLPLDTPAAVVYRATWDDQKIVRGTLADIAEKVKRERIARDSVIIVGEPVAPREIPRSSVYHPAHGHSYRPARHDKG